MHTRWLAVDHGSKRIGLALGTLPQGIVAPVEVLAALPAAAALKRIGAVAAEYGAQGAVVGLPLNMDDTEGPQAAEARAFAAALAAATGLDVRMWDERLSSFSADQDLAGAFTRKQKRRRQDAVAAAHILKAFFAADGPSKAPRLDISESNP